MGSIPKRKRELLRRLEGVDRAMLAHPHQGLVRLQGKLWAEYLKVVHQEELIWFQKSRCKWLQFGDRNTRFFHMTTTIKKRRKVFDSLMNDNDHWLTEPEQLKVEAASCFRNLYSADTGVLDPVNWPASYNVIEEDVLSTIQSEFTGSVQDGSFQGSGTRWPESSFLPVQSHWNIVGDKVCDWVKSMQKKPHLIAEVNDNICLIPRLMTLSGSRTSGRYLCAMSTTRSLARCY